MKSKKLMLSMVAILISFFALVGCEKKTPTPTPTPEPIPPVVATKESFTKYFNDNIFVEYNTRNLPDQNGDIFSVEKNTYKMLVDRQITLLADNVLYRLFSIYGPGASNNFVLTDILNNNQPFVLKNATGEYNAEINQEDILLKAGNTLTDRYCFFDIPSDLPQSSVAHKEFVKDRLTTNPSSVVYLNEPAFYASMFYINNGIYDSSNKDLLMSHFKFTHAINGEFAWSDETGDFTSDFTQYAWNWSYGEKANDINNAPTFEKGYKIYRAMYLPELKLAIANIFATGNFTSTTTYDILRQSITNINLNKTMTFEVDVLDNSGKTVKQTRNQTRLELIKEFILTQIIGSNNAYAFDNDVYSDFAQHAGRDNFAILDSLTINTLPDTTHLYKAYDVIC